MKPPGTILRAIAARLFDTNTMERLVDPAIADLQAECAEASRTGSPWRRRAIWVRGHAALFTMLVAHAPRRTAAGVSLDVRLALRLLVKHSVLTVVGTIALAFAIWSGIIAFEFHGQVLHPTLPLDGGERIVGVVLADRSTGRDTPATLHDFDAWRGALTSVEHLSAFRTRTVNLIVGSDAAEPVEIAEISPAAFGVARVPALLGRTLTTADQEAAAPAVVVIGHDVWQRRFATDGGIVGREIRLGNISHTIVGVMPEGFRFPISQSYWVPLRLSVVNAERGQSPVLQVLGNLVPGASLDTAQAELSILGAAAAARFPETHRHLSPAFVPYVRSVMNVPDDLTFVTPWLHVLIVLIAVLICGNVALLLFARVATRESEIALRAALGASRGRIIGQLFVEALVLAAIAGATAMATARIAWGWMFDVAVLVMFEDGPVPFWFHRSLSPATIGYAILLTLLAAAIAGLLPGYKATRGLGMRLKQATAGGGGLQLGGMWTILIVMQVAVMVVAPLFLNIIWREHGRAAHAIGAGFPSGQYLSATVEMDPDAAVDVSHGTFMARFARRSQELERKLEAEPGVIGVTRADTLPLMAQSPRWIGLDQGPAAPFTAQGAYRVSARHVAPDFFEVMDARLLSGRQFHSGDLSPAARNVIVNQSFVRLVLGGNNPIGRRLRYVDQDAGAQSGREQPWFEIVGVVEDVGIAPEEPDPKRAQIHHPVSPMNIYPVRMAVRTSGDPQLLAPRVREIATAIDPTLRLQTLMPLELALSSSFRFFRLIAWMIGGLTGVVLLISLTGIYTIFSFTASRRGREVGIRVALGAAPRHIVIALFRRPIAQIALGTVLGFVLALIMEEGVGVAEFGRAASYGSAIVAICVLATLGPVRRALGVRPIEALRAE